jgi:exodeoxyribonuclease VII large subunit
MRMTNGVKVRIRGTVELYQARGQLQLKMIAIDPAYTLGDLAVARAALLARLKSDGSLVANGRLAVPILPLRVALVTSLRSAAHADFRHELEASGFAFHLVEVDARVQGLEADETVEAALWVAADAAVDVVCIVRGGGAQTDLAAFDTERIARAIAAAPMPVFVGIGHEIDRSIADEVAHSSFKTPTACAAALVDAVRNAVDQAEAAWAGIARLADRRLDAAANRLVERSAWLERGVAHRLDSAGRRLDAATLAVVTAGPRRLRAAERDLDGITAQVRAFDPSRIVERGWSLTRRADGSIIRTVDDLTQGDSLITRLSDGEVRSTVDAVESNR